MKRATAGKLGPYEITGLLGAGGMGEVYRARDARLNRQVAIKVLPAELNHDPGRRARFEQEARAVAAINHPGIVALFDIGAQDDVLYMVTELVEGETLRGALREGPLSPRRAVEIGVAIAQALAAAHARGVTHRDLKPENVMITADGRTKLLDFGLAKAGPRSVSEQTATVTTALTDPGAVMGTPGYMSPEQVRGQEVDSRSDVFSFGAVLHEMLSGERTFLRQSGAETAAAIVREEPAELPESVPAGLRQVVRHCLEKEPSRRFQSAADLAFALESLGSMTTASRLFSGPGAAAPRSRKALWTVIAGLTAVLGGAGVFVIRAVPPQARLRFTCVGGEQGGEGSPRFSPDGKLLAYFRGPQIVIRSLESSRAMAVNSGLFSTVATPRICGWSRDGSFVYYAGQQRLLRVSASGGKPQVVLSGVGPGSLAPDSRSYFYIRPAPNGAWDLLQAEIPAGVTKTLMTLPRLSGGAYWRAAELSPDGRRMALVTHSGGAGGHLYLYSWPDARLLGVSESEVDLDAGWFADGGHLLITRNDIRGQGSLSTAGRNGVLERTLWCDGDVLSTPAVSPDGRRVAYAKGTFRWDVWEYGFDPPSRRPVLSNVMPSLFPDVSADGKWMAYWRDGSLWVMSLAAETSSPIAPAKSVRILPRFSPDSSRIAYSDGSDLYVASVSGGRPVLVRKGIQFPAAFNIASWSADGNWVAVESVEASGPKVIKVSAAGDGASAVLCDAPPRPSAGWPGAEWSPDGQWMAYATSSTTRLMPVSGGPAQDFLPEGYRLGRFAAGGKTFWAYRFKGRSEAEMSVFEVPSGRLLRSVSPMQTDSLYFFFWFCVTPDGGKIYFNVGYPASVVWMLEGFPRPNTGILRFLRPWVVD